MKKFIFLSLTALLSVSLFLTGCPTDAETKTITHTTVLSVDTWVINEAGLIAALADSSTGVIGVKVAAGITTLTGTVTVHSGRTVVLYTAVTTNGGELLINAGGKVIVGSEGVLTATSATYPVTLKGALEVQSGGELVLTAGTVISVSNGAESPETALGSVTYSGGSLVFTVAGDLGNDATKIGTLLGSINGNGTLEIGAPVALAPSVLAGINNISASKGLKVASSSNQTGTAALTIPAGADITANSGDTFATITGLTVQGKLTLDPAATLEDVTAVSVSGELNLGANTALTLADATGVTTTGTGKIVSTTTTPASLKVLLDKAGTALNVEQGAVVTLGATTTVKAGTVLTLTGSGSITNASSNELAVKGKIVAGKLVVDGKGTEAGITTTFGAGVTISEANGLSIGIADKITIPATASINLGGTNGITLGAGDYAADTAAVLLKTVAGVPTLTFTSNGVLLVGSAIATGGLLTVGSESAIVKVGTAGIFTANTEASPPATKLAVTIAAEATITNTTGNDGGITVATGAIAARTTNVPGVSTTVGLQLLGSSTTSAGWQKGTPGGVES